MDGFIYQWIDFIWLPIGLFIVHKDQRLISFSFILTCLLTLRTQVELMESIGKENGILTIMDSSLYARGIVIYSLIIMIYLMLLHFSPSTFKTILFAASLSIYIFAFCLSMTIMVL